jgi:hypothetical protein
VILLILKSALNSSILTPLLNPRFILTPLLSPQSSVLTPHSPFLHIASPPFHNTDGLFGHHTVLMDAVYSKFLPYFPTG